MRISGGRLLVSPSDVVEATTCTHRALTALRVAAGVQVAPPADPGTAVASAGDDHEARVTAQLSAGRAVADLSGVTADLDAWEVLAERTLAHLRAGTVDLVVQGGVLAPQPGAGPVGAGFDTVLVGRPDFLVATPGGWRVEDAKLARSLKPSALLQTMLYRDALAAAGVAVAEDVRLHLGDGTALDVPARSADAWARHQLRQVTALLADLPARGALQPGFTMSVEWCSACEDGTPCAEQRRRDDHLSGVAEMRREAARRLVAAGIGTIAALATAAGPVPGLRAATFEQLREQAALQVQAARTGQVPVRVRPHPALVGPRDVRPGLWLLPEPDPGDVFFDMEGDPLYTEAHPGSGGSGGRRSAGLEYLFGATHDGERFTAFWGHSREQEGAAFTAFVDWVEERRGRRPGLHVYHYAPYERSALTRLAAAHATRADVVDSWLADGVLVDLYAAVRRGLRAGIPSYSIKKVEALYGAAHTGEVATAAASIEQYEAFRCATDPAVRESLRAAIESYNRDDCDSTRDLRDYLLALRAAAVASGDLEELQVGPDELGADDEAPPPSATSLLRTELAAAAAALLDGAGPGAPDPDPVREGRRVLAGLLGYAVREEKAAWQDVFRVAEQVATDGAGAAVDDAGVLGGLTLVDSSTSARGAAVWTFTAPLQEHRITPKQGVLACIGAAPLDASVTSLEVDGGQLRLSVTMSAATAARGGWSAARPPAIDALLPSGFVPSTSLQRSLLDLAAAVLSDPAAITDPAGPRAAGRALLLRRASLRADALPPALPGEDAVARAVRLARDADGLVIAVQGPPGAGKSYLGSRVVDALVTDAREAGRGVRIGVTANSHAVVQHLLRAIHARTPGAVVRHKESSASSAKDPGRWTRLCEDDGCAQPVLVTGRTDGWAQGEVLGGTAWAFAPEDSPPLDLLVVDEAGQMSLGDVLAASRNARAVLLLGDPQQLAKPSRAAHPDGVAASALEHLAGGAATIGDDVGIFLDATWRMHPDVTGFISDIAYDGRLTAAPPAAERVVLPLAGPPGAGDGDPLSGTGLRWVPVEHTGNSQGSAQECAAVVALVGELLRRQWREGTSCAPLTTADVLVVAPFTVQVRSLARALAAAGLDGVEVGTVDRFQGREAVAVVYSTASSDAEDAPRGLGFLYDVHRLNVAVSRAQCLAFWVGSPALLTPRVAAAAQVPLVDAHCRFVERAAVVRVEALPATGEGAGAAVGAGVERRLRSSGRDRVATTALSVRQRRQRSVTTAPSVTPRNSNVRPSHSLQTTATSSHRRRRTPPRVIGAADRELERADPAAPGASGCRPRVVARTGVRC